VRPERIAHHETKWVFFYTRTVLERLLRRVRSGPGGVGRGGEGSRASGRKTLACQASRLAIAITRASAIVRAQAIVYDTLTTVVKKRRQLSYTAEAL